MRVIPRLDIKGPNLIKGICSDGQRALGRPEDFAQAYSAGGADELFLYDTVASLLQRPTSCETVARVADRIAIPLAVAGGLNSLSDIRRVLRAGADKVAINSGALRDPELLRQAAQTFGTQCVIASVEYYTQPSGRRELWSEYGREVHTVSPEAWIERVVALGAGEIMLTAIDRDGRGVGFDLAFIAQVARQVPVPVIAGGGAGLPDHLVAAAEAGAEAVAAASLFHYARVSPSSDRYLNWPQAALRKGADVDAGNIDFVNEGYGGQRAVPVVPCDLSAAKDALRAAGFAGRLPEVKAALQ